MFAKLAQFVSRTIRWRGQNRAAFLIGTTICLVSVLLYGAVYIRQQPDAFLQFLENIELRTLDLRFQLRGTRQPGPAVVIVAIDQHSQDLLGRWPFPRSYFAQTVDFLRQAQARVIAFDINFPQVDQNSALEALRAIRTDYDHLVGQPQRTPAFESSLKTREADADNDQQFAAALSHADNAVLGYIVVSAEQAKAENQERLKDFLNYLSFQAYPQVVHPEYAKTSEIPEAQGISPDLPEFASNAKNFGFFNIVPDHDGTVRREPVVMTFQGSFYPSLDVAAALAYTNSSLEQVKVIFKPNGVDRVTMGPLVIPTDRQGFVQIDYDGAARTFPTYSLGDVVHHKVPPSIFRDRLVLIGPTATGISDMALTPFQETGFPGIEIHANMIDDILYQHFVRRGRREKLLDLAFLILFSVGAGWLVNVLSPLRATLLLAGSLFTYFWFTDYLFAHYRMWLADFLPMATLVVTYAGTVSYRFFFEEGEKRKVRSAFSQYMHPALISQMLSHPEALRLGGEEKVLTAMFADIRGFTTISEDLAPTQLVELLNEYLSEMTEVIFKNWGTVDKYIGDAIMAFWGAPYPQTDQALRACRTSLEMLQALRRLQKGWEARNVPRLEVCMGINTGSMLVGNMGSRRRSNYTVVGDSVNLASRLEGLNRQFGTDVIISESTYLQAKDHVVARELDLIRVKGKAQPVKVYELLGMAEDAPRFTDLRARFEQALEAYRSGQWNTAIEMFQAIAQDYPLDRPSHVFTKRCRDLVAQPPGAAWDGVFVMTSK